MLVFNVGVGVYNLYIFKHVFVGYLCVNFV